MAGFQLQTPSGIITIQARQVLDGSWLQEIAASPARLTGITGSERLAVTNSAVISLSPPANATSAVVANETNDIRWYYTGETPTAGTSGNGPILNALQYLEVDLANFAQFKMVAVSSSSIVQVVYHRYG